MLISCREGQLVSEEIRLESRLLGNGQTTCSRYGPRIQLYSSSAPNFFSL